MRGNLTGESPPRRPLQRQRGSASAVRGVEICEDFHHRAPQNDRCPDGRAGVGSHRPLPPLEPVSRRKGSRTALPSDSRPPAPPRLDASGGVRPVRSALSATCAPARTSLSFAANRATMDERDERQESAAQPQRCDKCARPWIDEREKWRTLPTVDGDVGLFCPERCARVRRRLARRRPARSESVYRVGRGCLGISSPLSNMSRFRQAGHSAVRASAGGRCTVCGTGSAPLPLQSAAARFVDSAAVCAVTSVLERRPERGGRGAAEPSRGVAQDR